MNRETHAWCDCGDGYPRNSYGAGYLAARGWCQNCDAAGGTRAYFSKLIAKLTGITEAECPQMFAEMLSLCEAVDSGAKP